MRAEVKELASEGQNNLVLGQNLLPTFILGVDMRLP
jgi:hypothetical protein